MKRSEKIDLMIKYLEHFLGTPYKYGGKVTQDGGLDCSGFVLEGLRAIGEWGSKVSNSQNIFNDLTKRSGVSSDKIERGDVIFFGKSTSSITHVAIAYGPQTMIEAGGNNTNGMVRLRPITWRRDKVAVIRPI